MQKQFYSFAGGPTMLPNQVKDLLYQKINQPNSFLQISSNSKDYHQLINKTKSNLYSLLQIPSHYDIKFVNGGAHLQFAAIPMSMLSIKGKQTQVANYTTTGHFSKLAFKQAGKTIKAHSIVSITYDSQSKYTLPSKFNYHQSKALFNHFIDNQTVQGLQYPKDKFPFQQQTPLIVDSSSSLLTKPIDWSKMSMCYAHAQKNCGISGITTMIYDPKIFKNNKETNMKNPKICNIFQYNFNDKLASPINILSLFAHYKMTQFIKSSGGVDQQKYRKRSNKIYKIIQNSRIYNPLVNKDFRSRINVTWRIQNSQIQKKCLENGMQQGLCDFKGHRTTGGFRASLFAPVPDEGINKLADFLQQFQVKNIS